VTNIIEPVILSISFDLEAWQADIDSLKEALAKVLLDHQETLKRFADEMNRTFESLREFLEPVARIKNNNKQQSTAYRQAANHRAQQQLQQVRAAQGTNNRHWVKHRRRY